MSEVRLRIIDAFTDTPYAGNSAGVVLLDGDGWPDEEWMRQVAAELNFSETAFAHPLTDDHAADWALRWFTPVVEADLCGHATLATAHAIGTDAASGGEAETPAARTTGTTGPTEATATRTVRFSSRSGVLPAHIAADGAITLDFPAAPLREVAVPAGLAEALGAAPHAVLETGATLRDRLVVLRDEAAVRALAPDLEALIAVTREGNIRGVIATAAAADPGGGYDFVSRFFCPGDGIPEDPVTGSAHTALAPYWSGQFGRDHLVGLQASARSGLVRTQLAGNSGAGDRVLLTGRAVTILDGTWLHGPPE